ncbi:unnamed protein product, partial [Closterium sp. NIES-54]
LFLPRARLCHITRGACRGCSSDPNAAVDGQHLHCRRLRHSGHHRGQQPGGKDGAGANQGGACRAAGRSEAHLLACAAHGADGRHPHLCGIHILGASHCRALHIRRGHQGAAEARVALPRAHAAAQLRGIRVRWAHLCGSGLLLHGSVLGSWLLHALPSCRL